MKKSRNLGMQTFDQALFDAVREQRHHLRRRAAQRRLAQRPAPADQAQQPARQDAGPVRRHRAPRDCLTAHVLRSFHDTAVNSTSEQFHASAPTPKPTNPPLPQGRLSGPGRHGLPMAGHLALAGHDVTVYNRTPAKAAGLVRRIRRRQLGMPHAARGGARAPTSCSAASATTTTCARVTLGADGAFAGMKPAPSSSTTPPPRPTWRASCTPRPGSAGLQFVDAPVSGGQAGAQNGLLTVMCGGDAAAFEAVKPVGHGFLARLHAAGRQRRRASWPRWSTRSASPAWCRACREAIAFGQQGRPGHERRCWT